MKTKLSIEDEYTFALVWRSLCHRFHKLKDLREHKRKVHKLEELEVGDDKAPVISISSHSYNYLDMSEQEV